MWSNIYDYYEIRSSESYSVYADTKTMQTILSGCPELIQRGKLTYNNAAGYPWLQLSLLTGDEYGYDCSNNEWCPEFNMVVIVCSKSKYGRIPAKQLDFLCRLAQQLQWELVQEGDGEGEEYVIVWQPQ